MARKRRTDDVFMTNSYNAGLAMNSRNAGQTNAPMSWQRSSDVNSFGAFRENRRRGLVQRMDINGNVRWVDPKTGLRADNGQPLYGEKQQDAGVGQEPVAAGQEQTADARPQLARDASLGFAPKGTTDTERDAYTELTRAEEARSRGEDPLNVGTADDSPFRADLDQDSGQTASVETPPEQRQPGGNPDEEEERAASKAGYTGRFDVSRNFLATDKVPDSIFGYPIVSRKEDYTPEDIGFFREHPEAGGYYDLGEGDEESQGAVGAGNAVPEMVSMETPKARKAEERRRREIEDRRRIEEQPSVSADTPALRAERARISEEARLSTGVRMPFTNVHVGAVPKEQWDRMTWEERDALVQGVQKAMEDGAAYAVPGMIIRSPAHLGEGMVAKAESMLKGRSWSDLPRAERLAIKRATGLEQIEGGLPGWAKESMTDPVLKPRILERAREWQVGDTTTGRRLGTYKDITEGGRDYMASLDEGQWTETWMRKAREGEMGLFNPLEETIYLTERADLAGKAPTVVHEGEHVSQSFTQFVKDAKIPYGYRPTEIEARIAEYRAGLSPEQRANSLLEESQNNWGQKWYHEELKKEQQKLLQQDAKGGEVRPVYPGSWNNPGNVQKGEVEYDGEAGSVKSSVSEGTFLKFRTPQDGLNAMAQSIGQMVREKIPERFRAGELPDDRFTIDNLVKVYAPRKDANDTDSYARFVSGWTGLARDQPLDLKNAGQMALLLDAMVRQDSGHPHADWFSAAERKTATGKMETPAKPRSKTKPEVKNAKRK